MIKYKRKEGENVRYYDLPKNKMSNFLGEKKLSCEFWSINEVGGGLHWHDYYTIDIIAEGKGVKFSALGQGNVGRGYMQLVMPSDIHHLCSKEKCLMYTVRFSPDVFPEGFDKLLGTADKFTTLTEENLKTVIGFAEAMLLFPENERLCLNMLESIMIVLQSQLCTTRLTVPDSFKRVLDFLDVNFRDDPSLAQTAKVGSYSEGYLSHLFKEMTGYTYSQYLTAKKLSYACAIMQKKELTLTDVAISSGFSSFETFSRAFRQSFGQTPKEYRKNIQQR